MQQTITDTSDSKAFAKLQEHATECPTCRPLFQPFPFDLEVPTAGFVVPGLCPDGRALAGACIAAEPEPGKWTVMPMVPNGTPDGGGTYADRSPVIRLEVPEKGPSPWYELISTEAPWAAMRLTGFRTRIYTEGAIVAVEDLKLRGGCNLFWHQEPADARAYDADGPRVSLRHDPIVRAPNAVSVGVKAYGPPGTTVLAVFEALMEPIETEAWMEALGTRAGVPSPVGPVLASPPIPGLAGLSWVGPAGGPGVPAQRAALVRVPFAPPDVAFATPGDIEPIRMTAPAGGEELGPSFALLAMPEGPHRRLIGFEVQIVSQSTNAMLLVEDLKVTGGTNLFLHEGPAAGVEYGWPGDGDRPADDSHLAGLRSYPIVPPGGRAEVQIRVVGKPEDSVSFHVFAVFDEPPALGEGPPPLALLSPAIMGLVRVPFISEAGGTPLLLVGSDGTAEGRTPPIPYATLEVVDVEATAEDGEPVGRIEADLPRLLSQGATLPVRVHDCKPGTQITVALVVKVTDGGPT